MLTEVEKVLVVTVIALRKSVRVPGAEAMIVLNQAMKVLVEDMRMLLEAVKVHVEAVRVLNGRENVTSALGIVVDAATMLV